MILAERGLLDLDDAVSRHVPEWDDAKVTVDTHDGQFVACSRPITLRDLLTHSAGLTYGFQDDASALKMRQDGLELPCPITVHGDKQMETPRSLEEFCSRLLTIPLLFQPGERFQYACGLDVLGRVIECVAKMPLDQFLYDEIITPLGMRDTKFSLEPPDFPRFARGYRFAPPDSFVPDPFGSNDESSPWAAPIRVALSGGGGLVGSSEDYVRFAEMLALDGANPDPGGRRILTADSVVQMRTDQLAPRHIKKTSMAALYQGFGLGLSTIVREGDPDALPGGLAAGLGTGGWGGAAATFFFVDPVHHLTCVIGTQYLDFADGAPTYRQDIAKLVYQLVDGANVEAEAK
jgi:CubicO group peptidase (beta-lactamase class C family)